MEEIQSWMIGGLFRVPLEYVIQRILHRLHDEGFTDLNNTDFFIFAHLRTHQDVHLVDLAKKTNVSKQSMLYLVNQLVERGYLQRTPDREDKRAQILSLTPLGIDVIQIARDVMRDVEEEFIRVVGTDAFSDAKRTLLQIVHALEERNH